MSTKRRRRPDVSDLIEVLAARERRAVERAEAAAGKLRSADSPVESIQVELEQALGDLRHYRNVTAELGDYARRGGVYSAGSGQSFLRDLRDRRNDGPAADR